MASYDVCKHIPSSATGGKGKLLGLVFRRGDVSENGYAVFQNVGIEVRELLSTFGPTTFLKKNLPKCLFTFERESATGRITKTCPTIIGINCSHLLREGKSLRFHSKFYYNFSF